ncbi:MAG: 3-hydroxyacyl-ACP dehydratase FabZ family protein [Chthoniobacterales bacterium]
MQPLDPQALGLPHREPFVFVDTVEEIIPGESARCSKTFAPDTDFFRGHFPGDPIVPGVILTEALAQTAGIAGARDDVRFLLSAVRTMKFPQPARPGERIKLHARQTGSIGGLHNFEVRASVGDNVVAEGQIILSTLN